MVALNLIMTQLTLKIKNYFNTLYKMSAGRASSVSSASSAREQQIRATNFYYDIRNMMGDLPKNDADIQAWLTKEYPGGDEKQGLESYRRDHPDPDPLYTPPIFKHNELLKSRRNFYSEMVTPVDLMDEVEHLYPEYTAMLHSLHPSVKPLAIGILYLRHKIGILNNLFARTQEALYKVPKVVKRSSDFFDFAKTCAEMKIILNAFVVMMKKLNKSLGPDATTGDRILYREFPFLLREKTVVENTLTTLFHMIRYYEMEGLEGIKDDDHLLPPPDSEVNHDMFIILMSELNRKIQEINDVLKTLNPAHFMGGSRMTKSYKTKRSSRRKSISKTLIRRRKSNKYRK